jgi:hypothetical protein
MWTFDKIKQAQLKVPIAICAGLVLCILVGLLVGGASFVTLKRVGLVLLFAAYALFLQQHTWKIGLAVALLGLNHIGWGFKISTTELSGMVAGLLISITWWRKMRVARPEMMETFLFRIFNLSMLAWLVYSGFHAVYTIMDPFNPYEFALKNFLKTVSGMTGPVALLFYFIHRPRGIIADSNMLRPLIVLGLTALIINIGIRIWGVMHGIYNPEIAMQLSEEEGYFVVPGFDLIEDPYILRTISPLLATTCAVVIGSSWLRQRSPLLRASVILMHLLCFVGAIVSGGRATIVFVFGLSAAALWLRGHYRIVLATALFGVIVALPLNLLPGALNSFPPVLQRSLQMIVFTQESEYAITSIGTSSSWRWELFKRSIAEWRSDPRIFWFGRATYKFGMEDIIARKRNIGEADMDISLRRGATHSLLTDLLVVYGICGLVIYFCFVISLLWLLWKMYRRKSMDEVGKMMSLICFLFLAFTFSYGIIGGATFPISVTWLLIALFGYCYREIPAREINRLAGQRQIGRTIRRTPVRMAGPEARFPPTRSR